MIWDFDTPFTQHFVVEESQIDSLRHTSNITYVEWCLEIAWAHSQALGLGAKEYHALDRAMALTLAEYQYLQSTRLGESLTAGTWITNWERPTKLERRVQIINANKRTTIVRAKLQFTCIEISTGKPKRPPPEFIRCYGPTIQT